MGLNLLTTPGVELPLIKGRFGGFKSNHSNPKPTVSYNGNTGLAYTTKFTLPAGKQLKATISYKAANCPRLTNPHVINTWVQIKADANSLCYITTTPNSVRDTRSWLSCTHHASVHGLTGPGPPSSTGDDQQEEDLRLSSCSWW